MTTSFTLRIGHGQSRPQSRLIQHAIPYAMRGLSIIDVKDVHAAKARDLIGDDAAFETDRDPAATKEAKIG